MQYASLDNGRSVKRDVHEKKTLSDSDKECVAIIVMHVVAPLSVGEDDGIAAGSAKCTQAWIGRAEDQYTRLGLDASAREQGERPIQMEGNPLPKPLSTWQWPWERGGSRWEKERAGG